jgi:sugar lactone lactonase YvrE
LILTSLSTVSTAAFGQLVPLSRISTVAGNGFGTPAGGYTGDGGPATLAELYNPSSAVEDSSGSLYIADTLNQVVRKVSPDGIISTYAGNHTAGESGDGGPATAAELGYPVAVAVDAAGSLYISDTQGNTVRKVDAITGNISTFAGIPGQALGTPTYSGDGGLATSAGLYNPWGLAFDHAGNLYIGCYGSVRKVNAATGIISTVAGGATLGSTGDGGPATSAKLETPSSIAFDSSDNLYIADSTLATIRKVTASTWIITTVVGQAYNPGYTGDGGPASAALLEDPFGIGFDSSNNLYIADTDSYMTPTGHNRIRMVSASTGIISTIAGDGTNGYTEGGGVPLNAEFSDIHGLSVGPTNNIYISDAVNNRIRAIRPLAFPATEVGSSSAAQTLLLQTTEAVTISSPLVVPVSLGGKKEYSVGAVTGCATDGVTTNPVGTVCSVPVTFSPAFAGLRQVPLQVSTGAGNVNIGLNGEGVSPLAVITPGTLSTVAGEVNAPNCKAYSGPALLGPLCNPSAGAVDFAGNVYVAAFYSNTVSKIDTSGNITVVAGTGAGGLSGVGGPATSATFDRPADVIVDPAGNVYFAAETAQQVFRIDAGTHILTSVAGNGTQGYSGDNGPATMASFNEPEGLALDTQGNLYVEDQDNNLIRKINTAGIITTVAGDPATINQGSPAYSGDGGPATKANLALCCGGVYASYDSIAVDAAGNLFIGDSGHHVVREVTTDGIIHTVAGNNALGAGYGGDGGPATNAQLNWPMGVAVDPGGDLYIADFSNNRIRKVDAATQTITTVAGNGTQGAADSGLATQASLNGPQKIVLDGKGNLYVADTKNNLVRKSDVSNPTLTFATPTAVGSTDTTDDPLGVVISNIGNAPLALPAPATGTNASVSADFSLYTGESGACPVLSSSSSAGTLGQGSSCNLEVNLTPVSVGSISGSLVLTDNSENATSPYATQTITLIGTGLASAGALTIAPTTQTFSATAVGSTSSSAASTISNTTSSAIYLSAGSLTDSKDFTASDNCNGIVSSGSTCTVTFAFTPQSSGPLTSTYSIHDLNNPSSPLTVVLSGQGAPNKAPTVSPSSLDFGNIQLNAISAAQTVTVKNNVSGGFSVTTTITGANASAFSQTNTCGSGLTAGGSCSIAVNCSPSATGPLSAQLVVGFSSFPSQSVALSCVGTGPVPLLTPSTIDFGSVPAGTTSAAISATLSNTGNQALSIESVTIVNASAAGFAQTNACGSSLAAGASCSIAVTCSPTTSGALTATLAVNFPSPIPQQMAGLSCTGIAPAAALTPSAYTFASTKVGSTAPSAPFTLSNSGTASLAISSITVTGTNGAAFPIASNGCGNSLAAGASCVFSVGFAPTIRGTQSATVTVVDSVGTQTSSLSGTGASPLPPPDFTLTATPASQTSYLGQSVSYQLAVASANSDNPFTNPVALTASGLPAGATAAFRPGAVTPDATTAQSVMTVTIDALQSENRSVPASGHPSAPAIFSAALLLLFGLTRNKRVRRQLSGTRMLLLLVLTGGLCASLAGCAPGTGFAVPQSTSTITITGTSGTLAHSATVTLTLK